MKVYDLFEIDFDSPPVRRRKPRPAPTGVHVPASDYVEPGEAVVSGKNMTAGPDEELQKLAMSYDQWEQGENVPQSPFAQDVD